MHSNFLIVTLVAMATIECAQASKPDREALKDLIARPVPKEIPTARPSPTNPLQNEKEDLNKLQLREMLGTFRSQSPSDLQSAQYAIDTQLKANDEARRQLESEKNQKLSQTPSNGSTIMDEYSARLKELDKKKLVIVLGSSVIAEKTRLWTEAFEAIRANPNEQTAHIASYLAKVKKIDDNKASLTKIFESPTFDPKMAVWSLDNMLRDEFTKLQKEEKDAVAANPSAAKAIREAYRAKLSEAEDNYVSLYETLSELLDRPSRLAAVNAEEASSHQPINSRASPTKTFTRDEYGNSSVESNRVDGNCEYATPTATRSVPETFVLNSQSVHVVAETFTVGTAADTENNQYEDADNFVKEHDEDKTVTTTSTSKTVSGSAMTSRSVEWLSAIGISLVIALAL